MCWLKFVAVWIIILITDYSHKKDYYGAARRKWWGRQRKTSAKSSFKTRDMLSNEMAWTVWEILNTFKRYHYLDLKHVPHFRNFRSGMLFFSSTSVYSWLKLLSQSEIILSFPRVCIDPRKHGLKAHQWVFVLNSLLHWAFTSANVTTGIFRLFLALTKVKRGFLKIYIYIQPQFIHF